MLQRGVSRVSRVWVRIRVSVTYGLVLVSLARMCGRLEAEMVSWMEQLYAIGWEQLFTEHTELLMILPQPHIQEAQLSQKDHATRYVS